MEHLLLCQVLATLFSTEDSANWFEQELSFSTVKKSHYLLQLKNHKKFLKYSETEILRGIYFQ